MPEGPEVEHSARKVNRFLASMILDKILVVNGPYLTSPKPKYSKFGDQIKSLKPHLIKNVHAHGKQMIFELKGPQYAALTCHFGMAGQWCWAPEEHHLLTLCTSLRGKTKELYFCDQRRFGTFSLLTEKELIKKVSTLGLQVLAPFTISEFLHFLAKGSNRMICEVLLDQKIFSGLGNYLR